MILTNNLDFSRTEPPKLPLFPSNILDRLQWERSIMDSSKSHCIYAHLVAERLRSKKLKICNPAMGQPDSEQRIHLLIQSEDKPSEYQ